MMKVSRHDQQNLAFLAKVITNIHFNVKVWKAISEETN